MKGVGGGGALILLFIHSIKQTGGGGSVWRVGFCGATDLKTRTGWSTVLFSISQF